MQFIQNIYFVDVATAFLRLYTGLKYAAARYSRYLVFCGRAKSNNRQDVAVVMEKLWFGDWFILMQLCKNMHPEIFHDLVTDLRDR